MGEGNNLRIGSISGDLSGNVLNGQNIELHQETPQPLPEELAALATYAQAVIQALPVLALAADQQQSLQNHAVQILNEIQAPQPERARLTRLRASLQAILENAASSALATVLLTMTAQ
ncbi:hypothetical protein AB0H37_01220 [Actinomadura sp. NPDC023710]|uniref:hypothetical protein n=1 Tax=Actinomadura sp. NPDC023710 TaxID=3158219 RepID=UPI0033D5388A